MKCTAPVRQQCTSGDRLNLQFLLFLVFRTPCWVLLTQVGELQEPITCLLKPAHPVHGAFADASILNHLQLAKVPIELQTVTERAPAQGPTTPPPLCAARSQQPPNNDRAPPGQREGRGAQ